MTSPNTVGTSEHLASSWSTVLINPKKKKGRKKKRKKAKPRSGSVSLEPSRLRSIWKHNVKEQSAWCPRPKLTIKNYDCRWAMHRTLNRKTSPITSAEDIGPFLHKQRATFKAVSAPWRGNKLRKIPEKEDTNLQSPCRHQGENY